MIEFVKRQDLDIINKALNEGNDVRIQRTKDSYRIVADRVTVLQRGDNKSINPNTPSWITK